MCDPYPHTVIVGRTVSRSVSAPSRGRARPTVFPWMPTGIGLLVTGYSFVCISRVSGLTTEKQGHEAWTKRKRRGLDLDLHIME